MSIVLRRPNVQMWVSAETLTFEPVLIVDIACAKCGTFTRHPGISIIDKHAEMWKHKYESLMGALNQVVADCTLIHGDDPMRQDFVRELLKVREKNKIKDERKETP